MHFSKTYSQFLFTLPSELRNSAIEYRQLKKLINELVAELESLGLTPEVLQALLQSESVSSTGEKEGKGSGRSAGKRVDKGSFIHPFSSVSLPQAAEHDHGAISSSAPSRAVYELGAKGKIVPRLRIWLREAAIPSQHVREENVDEDDSDEESRVIHETSHHDVGPPFLENNASWSLTSLANGQLDASTYMSTTTTTLHRSCCLTSSSVDFVQSESAKSCANCQVIIPLASDTAFFRLLADALESLSMSLSHSQTDFSTRIGELVNDVSATSRPASRRGKSDLDAWRSVFQVYMEAQIFESTSERYRGEHSVEGAEARLAQFAHRARQEGCRFRLEASRVALETFLALNARILSLKKFQRANTEAARKILKKHTKRTALPLPTTASELIPALELSNITASISHALVVLLTESLMPIIPVIEDYLCFICTSIAYKPIRLNCGHLFCVRCLVKMQKKGKDNCPMCRAPTVVVANASNLDHALVNFMLDWFPAETKRKADENDYESTKEQMAELGLDTKCIIM